MRAAVVSIEPVESWHGAQVGQPLCVWHALSSSVDAQISEWVLQGAIRHRVKPLFQEIASHHRCDD
jgi:hypothetical protein